MMFALAGRAIAGLGLHTASAMGYNRQTFMAVGASEHVKGTPPMRIRFAAAVFAAMALASCSKVTSPSNNQVENWTGTLAPLATVQAGQFNVPNNGEYSITLTSLAPAPPTTTFLTVALGLAQGGQCSLVTQQPFAIVGQQALGGSINQGTYCVLLSDQAGALKQTVTYGLKVSHP